MGYFISIYYKDDIPAQRVWANTKALAAIESGDPRLQEFWPGQLCCIGCECAIPPELAMPPNSPTPYIAVFKQVGASTFQLMKSGFGFLEKWQILALLDDLPEPTGQGGDYQPGDTEGGGGVNPLTDGSGSNPFGLFNVPWWVWAIGIGVILISKDKRNG